MDLIAPNPLIMKTGFIQLGIFVVILIIGALKRASATSNFLIWAKLNAPIVSVIVGELWAIAAWLLFKTVPTVDDYFIVGIWIAGGSNLVASIAKDAIDGSVTTASAEGVRQMRIKNPSKGGIGG